MSRIGSLGHRLYSGDFSYNIVGHRRRWYILSAVLLAIAAIGLLGRGLNMGIEFKGGAEFRLPATSCNVEQAREVVSSAGVEGALVTIVGGDRLRIQTPALTPAESNNVVDTLAKGCKVPATEVQVQLVGPSWGGEITKKALMGLVVFLLAVVLFLSIYFEWKMALAALIALIHDLFITIGIYALTGFEVTPATVIGLLTILGYSLYDTVVVFDKVKENTRGIMSQSRQTYSEAADLAVNQTIVRSINTSIVALLPVAAILFVGWGLLGAGTLKDLALALFIGMAAGAYSSIFIATPLLVQLKDREPAVQALDARVASRRSGLQAKEAAKATKAEGGDPEGVGAGVSSGTPLSRSDRPDRPHRSTGPRNQPKRAPRSKR